MFENTADKIVVIDGKTIKLKPLAPEGLSTILDYIRKTKKPPSAVESFLANMDKLKDYPALMAEGLKNAQKMDHEIQLRERFANPEVPLAAFFDEDVCVLLLHATASPNDPKWTMAECEALVKKMGPIHIVSMLGTIFPANTEKKDPASSDSSSSSIETSGPTSATKSSSPSSTDGPPNNSIEPPGSK